MKYILLTWLLIAALPAVAQTNTAQFVRLNTRDGVEVIGTFYPAPTSPAPAVLLLHGLGQNRQYWDAFAKLLQQAGIASLAIDLRGHGDSIKQQTVQGPVRLDVSAFKPKDFQDMLIDLNAAYDWLAEQKGVNRRRIGIVGSSISANLAVRYALFNDDVAALVLLSPGLGYREVHADDAIGQLHDLPLRVYVSLKDTYAHDSCKRLLDIRREAGHAVADDTLTICTGNLHGTQLLYSVQGLAQQVAGWLQKTLATPPP